MNWKRATIAVLMAAPLIALLGWGFTRDPAEIPSPLPGKGAPSFALQVFLPGESPLAPPVGATVRLDSLRGQIVVLNFWASWCGPCRAEHAGLTATARRYAGRPVHFFGVLYNDKQPAAMEWITRMGGQAYPALEDPGARTAIDYGLYGVPETFFIDGAGRIAFKQTGPVTPAVMARVIDSLLASPTTSPDIAKKASQ